MSKQTKITSSVAPALTAVDAPLFDSTVEVPATTPLVDLSRHTVFDTGTSPPATNTVVSADAGEQLRRKCVGSRLSLTPRLITTRGFDSAEKQQVADALKVRTKRAIRGGGFEIYDMGYPLLKEYRELYSRIEKRWKSTTYPLASENIQEGAVEGGTRLIPKDQVDSFHVWMTSMAQEVATMARRMNQQRDSIIEAARSYLGDEQFNFADYPAEFVLGVFWSFPPDVATPNYLSAISPAAYQHQLSLVQARFERTADVASANFFKGFAENIRRWSSSLGPVVTLDPPGDHPLARLSGAEIRTRLSHSDDESIPEGKFRLLVRVKDAGGKPSDEVLPEFTQTEIDALRPQQHPDRRYVFKANSVETLRDLIEQFRGLRQTFTPGEDFNDAVDRVEAQLNQLGLTSEEIAKTVRDNQTLRNKTYETMKQLDVVFNSGLEKIVKKRRSIDKNFSVANLAVEASCG
jgi:hypothetical protein